MSNFIRREWYANGPREATEGVLINTSNIVVITQYKPDICDIEVNSYTGLASYRVKGTLEELSVHIHAGGR